MAVEWAWIGKVTPTSAEVVTRLDGAGSARLAVSLNSDLSSPVFGSPVTADGSDVARLAISGLTANTEYFWAVEHDGVIDDTKAGRFKTFPSGAANFTIAAGSCAGGTPSQSDFSNHPVFDWIRDDQPLVFLHMGDFHYRDLLGGMDTQAECEAGIEGQLLTAKQGECWRKVPIAYTWSNHEFVNGALAAYDHYVPHYTRPDASAVYHTFVVGRVRVIMLDTQAYLDPPTTTLGATQKQWFKDTLLAATEPLIVVSTERPWIGDDREDGNASWRGVSDERQELAEFYEDHDLTRRLLLVGGDMHAVAIDNGDNSQYDPAAITPGPVVFQCASLSVGGGGTATGDFSYGVPSAATGVGQYGTIAIVDDGADIVATCTGWRVSADGATRVGIYRHSFTVFGSGAVAQTRTYTVGATGRNYSSLGAAVSAIKAKSLGHAGDSLVFEVYNDAAFDETVTYDPEPGWYRQVTFRAAAGHRHRGVAGGGARIARTSSGTVWSIRHGCLTIDGLEVDCGNQLGSNQRAFDFASQSGWVSTALGGGGVVRLTGLIVHGLSGSAGGRRVLNLSVTGDVRLWNSILYGFAMTASSGSAQSMVNVSASTARFDCLNVTIDDVSLSAGAGNVSGIAVTNNANKTIRNCLVTRVTTGGSGSVACFAPEGSNVVRDHNASDDATADGTGSVTGIVPAQTYVDLGNGNYRLRRESALRHAGSGLGAAAAVDVANRDRDAKGDTWDIGAYQVRPTIALVAA